MVNPHLGDALAHWLDVAKMAQAQTPKTDFDASPRLPIAQLVQPKIETIAPDKLEYVSIIVDVL